MKVYGRVNYSGDDYYYEYSTSTGRHLWRLYNRSIVKAVASTVEGEPEIETLHNFPVSFLGTSNPSFKDFLIGSILYTTKRDIYSITGNIGILEKIIAEMQKAMSYSYAPDNKAENIVGMAHIVNYTSDDKFNYKCAKFKGCVSNLEFETPLCFLNSFKEDTSCSTSFTTPKWIELKSDIFSSASNSMKTRIAALQFKSLAQLRIEKDLSWYFNEDGTRKKDYRVLSLEEFDYYCEHVFPQIKVAAIDIESNGLDFYESQDKSWLSQISGFGISWAKGQGIYLPIDHESVENIPQDYLFEKMKPFLESWQVITHNGLFDGRVFYHYGIKLNIVHDTMQLGFCINPHVQKGSKALKQMTFRRYGHETLELKDIVKNRKDVTLFRLFPKDLIEIYACADVDYTLCLALDMLPELDAQTVKPYRRDISLYPELIKSEYKGNAIDLDLMERLSGAEERDMETLTSMMFSYVGKQVMLRVKFNEMTVMRGLTKEQADLELFEYQKTEEYLKAKIEFKLTGKELIDTLYTLMEYPVLRETKSKTPSVDKFAIEDLQNVKLGVPSTWLSADVTSEVCTLTDITIDDKEKVLVSAKEFNSCAYPVAYLLSKYNKLNKRKTSFFNPIKADNRGGRYYTSNSLSAAETSRIINKIQILSGYLKRLVIPYDPAEWYMCVFDYKQIEYRVMAGLAGQMELVERLQNPRADYHREGGAPLLGTTPAKMTSKQRKMIKAVNFAVPYGMLAFSLACNIFNTRKPTDKQVQEAEVLLSKWYATNPEIKMMLDAYRKFAAENGYVRNPAGRKRVFDMAKLTAGQISRMAGNYPIQSYAAEIFKIAFLKFRNKVNELGLGDKIVTTALVHDEMVNMVHKSVNPFLLYKIIWEECMLELEGHPRYFVGVSICNNWYEGKSDLYEAPVEYVGWATEQYNAGKKEYAWVDNPRDLILNDIRQYMPHLYVEEMIKWQPDISADNIRFDEIMPNFTDYFLIPSAFMYFKPTRKIDKSVYGKSDEELARLDRDALMPFLESALIAHYQQPITVTYPDGSKAIVSMESVEDIVIDLSQEFMQEDFILDEIALSDQVFFSEEFNDEFEESFAFGEVEYSKSIPTRENPLFSVEEAMDYASIVEREGFLDKRTLDELVGKKQATYNMDDFFIWEMKDGDLIIDMTGRYTDEYLRKIATYFSTKQCQQGALGSYRLVLTNNKTRVESSIFVRNFSDFEIAKLIDKNMIFAGLGGAEYNANVTS